MPLVLKRQVGEAIVINRNVTVLVDKVTWDRLKNKYTVKLCVSAPQDVPVDRQEVHVSKMRDGMRGGERE